MLSQLSARHHSISQATNLAVRCLSTKLSSSIYFSDGKQDRIRHMDTNLTVCHSKTTQTSEDKRRELSKQYISKNANRFGLRGNDKKKLLQRDDWSLLDAYQPWNEYAVKPESQRCLSCVDAPCGSACPANIDVKAFIHCLKSDNFYGAAKAVLSANPLGLSCGQLCDVNSLCKSVCVLENNTYAHNGIEIGKLQEYAVQKLKQLDVRPIRDPKWRHVTHDDDRICLVGFGAASISCATFLSRLGYKHIDIFEREQFIEGGGGVLKSQVSKLRHDKANIGWEVAQLLQLNPDIDIKYGQCIDLKDKSGIQEKLMQELGYDAVFIGAGNQRVNGPHDIIAKRDDVKIFNSKTFLNAVNLEHVETPRLSGHALVFGIGDVALDCAVSAYRCGAQQVSVGFRRSFADIRCSESLFVDAVLGEKCDIVPNIEPISVDVDADTGKLKVTVRRTVGHCVNGADDPEGRMDEILNGDAGYTYDKLSASTMVIECDHLITAFGQGLDVDEEIVSNAVNEETYEWLFGGGDFTNQRQSNGPSSQQSVVNAANDGKLAAWNIHQYLRRFDEKLEPNELPLYYTEIDDVDITVEMGNLKLLNPFGLSSAPPTTSLPMIERAFEMGWAFAVTKTFTLDKDLPTNVTPRIYAINDTQHTFANIELISEKTARYWCQGSNALKAKYPDHVLIASIMASTQLRDWQELITLCTTEGHFDAIELNLSCPHGMTDMEMGAFIGHSPELTRKVTEFCVQASNVPVFVKATIETDEIAFIKNMVDCKAFGITAINTIPGINDSDDRGVPYPNVGKENQTAPGGVAGDALRPFATKVIANINKYLADNDVQHKPYIFGCGGVNTGQNALHLMRYGAHAVQICSAVMENDFSIIYDLETGLKQSLYLNGHRSVQNDGVQKALIRNIAHVTDMDVHAIKVAHVDDDLCINCGKCYKSCVDNGYQAIEWDAETRTPLVVDEDCTGCGLCLAVCPIKNAIQMVARPDHAVHYIDRGEYKEEIETKW